jgi:hypothetical protein
MSYQTLFTTLWEDYTRRNPHARNIYDLFVARGEHVVNDHIALRTFNDPRIGVEALASAFTKYGYEEKGTYNFPVKKLFAKHYEHPDPEAPKVFISELLIGNFSPMLQDAVKQLTDTIATRNLSPEALINSSTSWQLYHATYKALLAESEYAAWMYAFGFCANHFTVNVNALKSFKSLEEVNAFLKQQGFKLNASGGEIKGTPADFLEQSSTLAEATPVQFAEGKIEIPSCYYEFARRYPMPDGKLYQGFVAASADKIFESTDVKNR